MTFSLTSVLAVAGGYLLFLFLIAWLTDTGRIPRSIVRHPAVYILSMGVYASSWAIYGSIGYAQQHGFNFLSYFLGISGVFFLAPALLVPLLRLTTTHQLSSLADVFAFRYRSPVAGAATALLMLISTLPILAMQIKAIADSLQLLTGGASAANLALWFCLLIALFTILFGTRHSAVRDKHEGLVMAIAAESVLKLICFGALAYLSVRGVFGGFAGLQEWLHNNPEQITHLYQPLEDGAWHSLILAFFIATLLMPHMFHMAFTENINPNALHTATWGVPLFMFFIALCIPFVLFAGNAAQVNATGGQFFLAVGAQQGPMAAILAYLAGLAAASGVLIVATIALSSMLLNHWVVPARSRRFDSRLYHWLLWARRALIVGVLILAYAFYLATSTEQDLIELGVLGFTALLQFTPGLIATLYWVGSNRLGFFAGLLVGFFIWFVGLLIPILLPQLTLHPLLEMLGLTHPEPLGQWHKIATVTVLANSTIFAIVSALTTSSRAEKSAAKACVVDSLKRSFRWKLEASNAGEMLHSLSKVLGAETAEREFSLALADLQLSMNENRPYALRRLRDQIKTNLSGLLGPSVAHDIVSKQLPYLPDNDTNASNEDYQLIEARMELYRDRLSGLAAELDSLRRFHRQTLLELPMGVISLGADGEIIGWNHAMEALTGVPARQTIGSRLSTLPSPWQALLHAFALGDAPHQHQAQVQLEQQLRWFNLHKSHLRGADPTTNDGQVIVMEDVTDVHTLEMRLNHAERLASIGRLAAGVAHEVGNPVTAIACLAQNLQHEDSINDMQFSAEQIITQTERISRIVESLMAYSHGGGTAQAEIQSPVVIADVVQEAIDLLLLDPERQAHHFNNLCHHDHQVKGDGQKIMQVFVNLLSNAADASAIGAPISIASKATDGHIEIILEDQGHGIPPQLLKVLFEPFVTSKEVGRGTGLGLALVYSIIEDHFGTIRAESPIKGDSGTRFIITLPQFTLSMNDEA